MLRSLAMTKEKFLIINPFGIGDVLFTAPVIKAIKESMPDSLIGFWSNQRVAELLKSNETIGRIFPLSRGDIKKAAAKSRLGALRGSLKLYSELKKEKFTVALDYSLDHRYSLACKLAGIKKRIGFNYKNRGRFLTDKLELSGYRDKHIIEYYLDLLQFINVNPGNRAMELSLSAQDKARAKKELADYGIKEGERLIGITPGGGESWGRDAYRKRWPAKSFARLADGLIERFAARVLIFGDESEKGIASLVADNMQHPALNLAGKTGLVSLAAFINESELLVTNDGGPLHIAAALGKKTASFFGPADPLVYGPYPVDEKRHIVLRNKVICSPCYQNFRLPPCARDLECLRGISVEQALGAVTKLMEGG